MLVNYLCLYCDYIFTLNFMFKKFIIYLTLTT